MPTPTTDRLLRTLTRWRLLDELPSGRFAAALPLRLATGMDRTTTPAPGLTVRWGVLHDTGVGYLEHRPVPGATGMPSAVGSTAVSGSALGLVLRSFRAAGTDAPATPEQWPPVDRGTVLTRLTGVAVVRRAAGAYLVAVPVVDAAGRVVVALETEVTDLDGAFGPAVDYLNDTARQLTGRLARTT